MEEAGSTPPVSPGKALLVLASVIAAVVGLMMLAKLFDLNSLYAGFMFLLYWCGIKHFDIKQFAPSLAGAMGGLATAWALHTLPVMFGTAGTMAGLAIVCVAIYLQIRNSVTLLINLSFMLFLTLGSIPALSNHANLVEMILAVLLAAGYVLALFFIMTRLTQALSRKTTTAKTQLE